MKYIENLPQQNINPHEYIKNIFIKGKNKLNLSNSSSSFIIAKILERIILPQHTK